MKFLIPDAMLNPAEKLIAGISQLAALYPLPERGTEKSETTYVENKADQGVELVSFKISSKDGIQKVFDALHVIHEELVSLILSNREAEIDFSASLSITDCRDTRRAQVSLQS